jgi:hypothetical protein
VRVPNCAAGTACMRDLGLDDPSPGRPDLHCNFGDRSIRARRATAARRALGCEPQRARGIPAIFNWTRQLEQALETYDGALLLVTHDRRMLQNVRLDRSWLVDKGRVADL